MKTFQQFNEDIEQRRKELRQRSREQMQRFKASAEIQRQRAAEIEDRRRLKDEIKSELRGEN